MKIKTLAVAAAFMAAGYVGAAQAGDTLDAVKANDTIRCGGQHRSSGLFLCGQPGTLDRS